MTNNKIAMEHNKKIAIIAHDHKKQEPVEWAKFNRTLFAHHQIYATGTTDTLLERELSFDYLIC